MSGPAAAAAYFDVGDLHLDDDEFADVDALLEARYKRWMAFGDFKTAG